MTPHSTASRCGSDTCSSRRRQGDRRVRARAQAGRTSLLVGMGQARGKPVDDDRHAGNRDGGSAGATRPGRAEHVPVRRPGIGQRPVRGRGAARRRRVGRRRGTRDAIARAVLGDDQRARLARSCGASAGRRTARERIAKAVIAKVSTYEEDGKVRVPGVARCIVGTK